ERLKPPSPLPFVELSRHKVMRAATLIASPASRQRGQVREQVSPEEIIGLMFVRVLTSALSGFSPTPPRHEIPDQKRQPRRHRARDHFCTFCRDGPKRQSRAPHRPRAVL